MQNTLKSESMANPGPRVEASASSRNAGISIIVPVFNEAENVLPLTRQVMQAMREQDQNYELLFVDDESNDDTWQQIERAHRLEPRVRGIRHRERSGQSAALWTGIQSSTAPVIATLDGDLQNDPADLPQLLEALSRADFVCGKRVNRKDNFVRRVSSRIARWARKTVLRVDLADTGCALRVFRRAALQGVFPFTGFHRFLPVLVHGAGVKTLEVPVNHRPRTTGVSKYGICNRLGCGIYDLFAVAWYQKRRIRSVAFSEMDALDMASLDLKQPAVETRKRQRKPQPRKIGLSVAASNSH
jgi:dolichol-phosphate mannosyltransferase